MTQTVINMQESEIDFPHNSFLRNLLKKNESDDHNERETSQMDCVSITRILIWRCIGHMFAMCSGGDTAKRKEEREADVETSSTVFNIHSWWWLYEYYYHDSC